MAVEESQIADTETSPPCPRCAHLHWLIACPFVKAVEFEDCDPRLIRRVEFLTPADYGRQPTEAAPEPDYPRMGPAKA